MIRLSEWRLKLVLSIPSVSIFAFLTQIYDIPMALVYLAIIRER